MGDEENIDCLIESPESESAESVGGEAERIDPIKVEVLAERPNQYRGLRPPFTAEFAARTRAIRAAKGKGRHRVSIGQKVIQHLDKLGDCTDQELRDIATNMSLAVGKRLAANMLVRASQNPDIADYQDFLDGKIGLEELRKRGINTFSVKKATQKSKAGRKSKDGTSNIILERAVELFPPPDELIEKIINHTHGAAVQRTRIDDRGEDNKLDFSKLTVDELRQLQFIKAKLSGNMTIGELDDKA